MLRLERDLNEQPELQEKLEEECKRIADAGEAECDDEAMVKRLPRWAIRLREKIWNAPLLTWKSWTTTNWTPLRLVDSPAAIFSYYVRQNIYSELKPDNARKSNGPTCYIKLSSIRFRIFVIGNTRKSLLNYVSSNTGVDPQM